MKLRAFGRFLATVAAAALAAAASAQERFHYDATSVDVAAHWAARATLADAMMFSGMGERLVIPLGARDAILKHAGYVGRPAMPKLPIVGAIYAAGEPRFAAQPDFADPGTLKWVALNVDRTLEPAAQAWALAKIASPEFHLSYHEDRAEKRVGLMMAPQAQAQAKAIGRLLDSNRLFAPRRPDGSFGAPRPGDQVAVLWAVSSLVLAATSDRDDYWHRAYRDLINPDDWRGVADAALAAVGKLPPATRAERGLAVEALGRYALTTSDKAQRERALALARRHADALREEAPLSKGAASEASRGIPAPLSKGVAREPTRGIQALADLGLTIYGLVEAGRLFGERSYMDAAAGVFRSELLPRWDERLGAFRPSAGPVVYTPLTLGALAAGLNALRWYGAADAAQEANRIYPRLFETVLVQARMLHSSPLPLVGEHYLKQEPAAYFAHPALPSAATTGYAPVFAGEVRHEDDRWRVTDARFRTAQAFFLANMLGMRREGRADAFLAEDRLAALRR
jgi:hypothetical protein